MITIVVHQLLCGEDSKKGWNLLNSTIEDLGLAKELAFNTDLSDQSGGIPWEKSTRGFLQKDHYLLMRTFPDDSPDVRRGRAFSHVLVINKSDLSKLNDIGPLIELLPNKIDKSIEIAPLNIEIPNSSTNLNMPYNLGGRFNKVIHGYLRLDQFNNTIIWIGNENFESTVMELWKRLNPIERELFYFGLVFNSDAILENHINLLECSVNVQSKFLNKGYLIIDKNDKQELNELPEQLILGSPEARNRIKNFENAIGVDSITRDQIENVEKVLVSFENIDNLNDLKKLITLSHVIATISSDSNTGKEFKLKLIQRICSEIEIMSLSDFHLMKAFKKNSFQNSQQAFKTSQTKWFFNNPFSVEKSKKNDYSKLFQLLLSDEVTNWWLKDAIETLKSFLSDLTPEKAEILLNWIAVNPITFQLIGDLIDSSTNAENSLILKYRHKFESFDDFKKMCIKRDWLELHATILINELDFEDALTQQLTVDNDYSHYDGIKIITKKVSAESLIKFSIQRHDPRLVELSSQLCLKNPKLLNSIDFENQIWIDIWLKYSKKGGNIIAGFKHPDQTISKLFDTLLIGKVIIYDKILVELINKGYSNLEKYPNRSKIWQKLPVAIRDNFLSSTANSILKKLSREHISDLKKDVILQQYILSNGLERLINKKDVAGILLLFENFYIPDNTLKNLFKQYKGSITPVEAKRLGILIRQKNYSATAHIIADKATKTNNWKITINECYDLLGNMIKFKLFLNKTLSNAGITKDQWWQAIEEVIIDLYETPQSSATLWKNAGGKKGDLIMNVSATDLWNDALNKLRKETVKGITMNSLMKELSKHYFENDSFKTLYNIRKNFIKT